MATGSLKLAITDVVNAPLRGTVHIDFDPARDSPGGMSMDADFAPSDAVSFTVTSLECRSGPGTLYEVRVTSANYRPYAFFQTILEDATARSSDNQIRMIVNPRKVKDIAAPAWPALHVKLRDFLDVAEPVVINPEDKDIVGLRGAALYDAIGSLRKACLLNLFAKAKHPSSARAFMLVRKLLLLRQDRCFCVVDEETEKFLASNDRYKSAPAVLHTPLPGYELGASFKSRDAHANIQFTLMRHRKTGEVAADIDIDESSGVEHGFEVIRNAITQGRTNPYLVRDLLALADPAELSLDPGYRFVFR